MVEPQGLWSCHLLRFVSAHSRGGNPEKEAGVPRVAATHRMRNKPHSHATWVSAPEECPCTWQQAGPRGLLGLQRDLHRTPAGSCHGPQRSLLYATGRTGPTGLCATKAGWGRAPASSSPRMKAAWSEGLLARSRPWLLGSHSPRGQGKRGKLGRQPAPPGWPGLARQGADGC